jgi:hypothetical protein
MYVKKNPNSFGRARAKAKSRAGALQDKNSTVLSPTSSFLSHDGFQPDSSTTCGAVDRNQRALPPTSPLAFATTACQVPQLPRARLALSPESTAWSRSRADYGVRRCRLLHRFVFPLGTATPVVDLLAARGPDDVHLPRPAAGARCRGLVLWPVRMLCPTGDRASPPPVHLFAEEQERYRTQFGFCYSPAMIRIFHSLECKIDLLCTIVISILLCGGNSLHKFA